MGDRMDLIGAPIPDFHLPYTTQTNQNGRVHFDAQKSTIGSTVPDSAGFEYPKESEINFASDMLRGNWDHTVLSDTFFTRTNVNKIQQDIKKEVYRMSGSKKHIIDNQDVDELKMIMRAMYLQYAKNSPFNIDGQINDLNKMVIEWCIPRIISEIEHYYYYLNDITHLPVPLEKPLNMSSAGTRSLPFKPMM